VSYFDYRYSIDLPPDPPFYGLVMAAMLRADSLNADLLRGAFPDVWRELNARYHAPGGVLDSDPEHLRAKVLAIQRRQYDPAFYALNESDVPF
jgi:hypothetical protein